MNVYLIDYFSKQDKTTLLHESILSMSEAIENNTSIIYDIHIIYWLVQQKIDIQELFYLEIVLTICNNIFSSDFLNVLNQLVSHSFGIITDLNQIKVSVIISFLFTHSFPPSGNS